MAVSQGVMVKLAKAGGSRASRAETLLGQAKRRQRTRVAWNLSGFVGTRPSSTLNLVGDTRAETPRQHCGGGWETIWHCRHPSWRFLWKKRTQKGGFLCEHTSFCGSRSLKEEMANLGVDDEKEEDACRKKENKKKNKKKKLRFYCHFTHCCPPQKKSGQRFITFFFLNLFKILLHQFHCRMTEEGYHPHGWQSLVRIWHVLFFFLRFWEKQNNSWKTNKKKKKKKKKSKIKNQIIKSTLIQLVFYYYYYYSCRLHRVRWRSCWGSSSEIVGNSRDLALKIKIKESNKNNLHNRIIK